LKLNWRLNIFDTYNPFSYHQSVNRVNG